jgi:hypothetical protein
MRISLIIISILLGVRMPNMEKFKAFFEQLYENFNERNIDAVVAHTTEDVKWANGMEGGYVYGHEGLKNYWTRQFTLINPKVIPLEVNLDEHIAKIKVHQTVQDLNGQLLQDKELYHYFHMQHNKIDRFDIGDEIAD